MMARSVHLFACSLSLVALTACGGEDDRRADDDAANNASAAEGRGGGAMGSDGQAGAAGAGGTSACVQGSEGGGASEGGCDGPGARFVTQVVSACFGSGQDFGRHHFPEIVYGPPQGGGCCGGSLDVLSLGNGGSIVVTFAGNAIVDGPGPDFIIFENPFNVGNDPTAPFAELATVGVSDDGVTWTDFPCIATQYPYGSCAGWHPVFASSMNSIDPLDPNAAGGDPFDLADIGVSKARFVRITDRPDTPGVFDLDAVGIVKAQCP
jgi:hypothetical protein